MSRLEMVCQPIFVAVVILSSDFDTISAEEAQGRPREI